jgi:hypothetical protein
MLRSYAHCRTCARHHRLIIGETSRSPLGACMVVRRASDSLLSQIPLLHPRASSHLFCSPCSCPTHLDSNRSGNHLGSPHQPVIWPTASLPTTTVRRPAGTNVRPSSRHWGDSFTLEPSSASALSPMTATKHVHVTHLPVGDAHRTTSDAQHKTQSANPTLAKRPLVSPRSPPLCLSLTTSI